MIINSTTKGHSKITTIDPPTHPFSKQSKLRKSTLVYSQHEDQPLKPFQWLSLLSRTNQKVKQLRNITNHYRCFITYHWKMGGMPSGLAICFLLVMLHGFANTLPWRLGLLKRNLGCRWCPTSIWEHDMEPSIPSCHVHIWPTTIVTNFGLVGENNSLVCHVRMA